MRCWLATLCLLMVLPKLLAGVEADRDNLRFYFQRGLDFFRWGNKTRNNFIFKGEQFVGDIDFYVMLRQPPGFTDQWKTSLKFNAFWFKPWQRNITATGSMSTEYFSDQQVRQPPPIYLNSYFPNTPIFAPVSASLTTGLNNRIYRQSAIIGVKLKDILKLNLSPSAGIYGERIMQSTAVGPAGGLEIEGKGLEFSGFQSNLSAQLKGQFLSQRTNREISANFSAARTYSEISSNLFNADYRHYVREFPLSNGATDRRLEQQYHLGNLLKYRIYEPLEFKIELNLSRRRVNPTIFDQTNRLLELSTSVNSGMEWKFKNHLLTLNFSTAGQNQSYPLRKVEGRQYRISTSSDFCFTQDSLKLYAMLSRNKYDVSPESYSIDTHDELRHSYILTHYHNFGEGLETETELRADLNHLVYLKSARSADNNWERFLLFSPEIRYHSAQWSQRACFRVSADYIDYDFEVSAPPSLVFRKFSVEDSLYIVLKENWGLRLQYLLLLEDQGQFDWEAFVQELSDEYRTHEGSAIFVTKHKGLEYGFGWAYYSRQSYHAESMGELSAGPQVESSGPLVSLYGKGPGGFDIEFSASYRRIWETFKPSYAQTIVDLTLVKML